MTREELAECYDRYSGAVYRTAFACCRNRADAEDIMQETFLRRLTSDRTFPEEELEKAWLLRVAANLSADHLRRMRRRSLLPLEEAELVCEMPQESAVFQAVMALPPDYRLAVHLFYYEGYSIAEIAGIMRKTNAAAAAVLSRARKRLKRMLGEEMEL